jgi:uncharacterized protein YoxC
MVYNDSLMAIYNSTDNTDIKNLFESIDRLVQKGLVDSSNADKVLESSLKNIDDKKINGYFQKESTRSSMNDLGLMELMEQLTIDRDTSYIEGFNSSLHELKAIVHANKDQQYKAISPALEFFDKYQRSPLVADIKKVFENAVSRNAAHIYCKKAIDELAVDKVTYRDVIRLIEAAFAIPSGMVKRYVYGNLSKYRDIPAVKSLIENLRFVDSRQQSQSFTRFASDLQIENRYSPIYRMRDGSIRFLIENRIYESTNSTVMQLDRSTIIDPDFIDRCDVFTRHVTSVKEGKMIVGDVTIGEQIQIGPTKCDESNVLGDLKSVVGDDAANAILYLRENCKDLQPVSRKITFPDNHLTIDIIQLGESNYLNVYDNQTGDNAFMGDMTEPEIVEYVDELTGYDITTGFYEEDVMEEEENLYDTENEMQDEISDLEDEISKLEDEISDIEDAIDELGDESDTEDTELEEMLESRQSKLQSLLAKRNRMVMESNSKNKASRLNLQNRVVNHFNELGANLQQSQYHNKQVSATYEDSGLVMDTRITAKYTASGFIHIYEANPRMKAADKRLLELYESGKLDNEISNDGWIILNDMRDPNNLTATENCLNKLVEGLINEEADTDDVKWKFLDYQDEMSDSEAFEKVMKEFELDKSELEKILNDADIEMSEKAKNEIKGMIDGLKRADKSIDDLLSSKQIDRSFGIDKYAGEPIEKVYNVTESIATVKCRGDVIKLPVAYLK